MENLILGQMLQKVGFTKKGGNSSNGRSGNNRRRDDSDSDSSSSSGGSSDDSSSCSSDESTDDERRRKNRTRQRQSQQQRSARPRHDRNQVRREDGSRRGGRGARGLRDGKGRGDDGKRKGKNVGSKSGGGGGGTTAQARSQMLAKREAERRVKERKKELYDFWEYESSQGGAPQAYLDYIMAMHDATSEPAPNFEMDQVIKQRMEDVFQLDRLEFLRQRKCMDDFLKTLGGDEELLRHFDTCLKESGKVSWWADVQDCPCVLMLPSTVRLQFLQTVRARQPKTLAPSPPTPTYHDAEAVHQVSSAVPVGGPAPPVPVTPPHATGGGVVAPASPPPVPYGVYPTQSSQRNLGMGEI